MPDIDLLHAPEPSHYDFNCDYFLVSSSRARRIAIDTFAAIVSLLKPTVLACLVESSPMGLVGAYPACFHLALANNIDVFALAKKDARNYRTVGNLHLRGGTALIFQDVLTTGAAVINVAKHLRSHNCRVLGALAIFDRKRGAEELLARQSLSQRQNCALVAIAGNVIEQPKIVRSPFDLPDICVGDTINIFRNTRIGDFGVLVCSDLANPEIIEKLKGNLDLLITVERNKAVNAYAHLAFTAAYEIGCYVLLANDSIHGPSLLAMPRKRERDRLRWLNADELEKISYMSLKTRDLRKKAGEFLRT